MSDKGTAPLINTARGLQPIGREIDVELHDYFKPFVDRHRRALLRHRVFRVVYNTLYGLALALVITVAGYLGACFFDYTPPSETKVELVNPSIRPGDDLRMRVVPNRKKLCCRQGDVSGLRPQRQHHQRVRDGLEHADRGQARSRHVLQPRHPHQP